MNTFTNLILCIAASAPLFAIPGDAKDFMQNPPSLTVRGNATIWRPADELSINIGVATQAETAETALRDNNSKMEVIMKSLKDVGLEKGDYKTGRFSIRPLYSQRPQNAAPDWSPEIVGYEAANSLAVKTEKIDIAGRLIDQATRAGANNIDSITFSIKDPRKYRAESIAAATHNALRDARSLSEAAGVTLVKIKSVSLEDAETVSPLPRGQFYAKTASLESVPIEAGDIEINSNVTVTYEIR